MKTATAGLAAALAAANSITFADCWAITLNNGTIVYYTSLDSDIALSGNTYTSGGPLFQRGKTTTQIGLEASAMDLTITPHITTAQTDLLAGEPWLQAAIGGALDNAQFVLNRAVLNKGTAPWSVLGSFIGFSGVMGELDIDRTQIVCKLQSDTYALDLQWPRNVFQPGCVHNLYDSGCTVSRSAKAVTGTVASGTSTATLILASLSQATGYFDLGYIVFNGNITSGLASLGSLTVKSWVSGTGITLAYPLPETPVAGDTFTIYPGCDKQQSTCSSKFSNLVNFRGFPYIPIPELAS